jgi:hypothetical protein
VRAPTGLLQSTIQDTALTLSFEGWVDGVYNLSVACTAKTGVKDPFASTVSWELDYTPPLVWPVFLPPRLNNLVTFNVSVIWSEELAGLWVSIDNSTFQSLPAPVNGYPVALLVKGTNDGVHKLALKGFRL